jgi:hypothetical protein
MKRAELPLAALCSISVFILRLFARCLISLCD